MLFNSLKFLLFFPLVLIIYYILPKRIKYLWLLLSSYYFYMCWNANYALLIFTSTLITYLSGIFIEKIKHSNVTNQDRLKKFVVAISIISNLGIPFFFKYSNYSLDIIKGLGELIRIDLNVPKFDILLPVGISFYTFQALSYTMDVYRDDIYAEKNFFKYALFVSFFPQLVAGPIERSKNLLKQLSSPSSFHFDNIREGFILMLWGYFLKLVVADRIAIFVDTVYGDYTQYEGLYLIIATILFAIQIYCDFSGYSVIAMGAAKMLGIQLTENFDAPYLSSSVGEFWRKWHISLTSWFKDYLYIPLGGSRKGQFRKYLNKLMVFLVSGLWHGAESSFIVWGAINGIYQILEESTQPFGNKIVSIFNLNKNSFCYKLLRGIITFFLIDFTWIFFRANNIKESLEIIKHLFYNNIWILFDGSIFSCGLDAKNFFILFISLLFLLIADISKHYGIKIRNILIQQDYWFRCISLIIFICFILVFGIWGSGYDSAGFIYFQF